MRPDKVSETVKGLVRKNECYQRWVQPEIAMVSCKGDQSRNVNPYVSASRNDYGLSEDEAVSSIGYDLGSAIPQIPGTDDDSSYLSPKASPAIQFTGLEIIEWTNAISSTHEPRLETKSLIHLPHCPYCFHFQGEANTSPGAD